VNRALWCAAGVVIGAVVAVGAIRASRTPGNIFFALRSQFATPAQDTSEANWLERTYGPDRQSMDSEEWIVRDFFRDRRDGVFVDVGAADYKLNSNSWYLETRLGWSGLAIDAQQEYREGYVTGRPRTKFFSLFVSDRSNENARMFVSAGKGASSSRRDFTESHGGVTKTIELPTITLNDLLDAQGIKTFDFLSMDIELAEPAALAGFDIPRFKPALAVVEAHPQVRQQILDYFAKNDYVVVGKYLRVDSVNLWFAPVGTTVAPFPFEDAH
jgi:FkbM family methyltransferase